jgi:hypothetical protein
VSKISLTQKEELKLDNLRDRRWSPDFDNDVIFLLSLVNKLLGTINCKKCEGYHEKTFVCVGDTE